MASVAKQRHKLTEEITQKYKKIQLTQNERKNKEKRTKTR